MLGVYVPRGLGVGVYSGGGRKASPQTLLRPLSRFDTHL